MILLYPLQRQDDYTELLFSLRSAEKYLPPLEVVIVGDTLPDWIKDVTWINLPDITSRKQLTIRKKIISALEYSDEVFFMNDDYYLLREIDPFTFPYFYHGTIRESGESGARILKDQLEAKGKEIKHFDTHVPLIYRKAEFTALECFTGDSIIKSMYCNYHDIPGIQFPDFKVNSPKGSLGIKEKIKKNICMSSGPMGLKTVIPILQEMFPQKSRFEI
jgi:hypothetical protein